MSSEWKYTMNEIVEVATRTHSRFYDIVSALHCNQWNIRNLGNQLIEIGSVINQMTIDNIKNIESVIAKAQEILAALEDPIGKSYILRSNLDEYIKQGPIKDE